jgi:hypothetical protein
MPSRVIGDAALCYRFSELSPEAQAKAIEAERPVRQELEGEDLWWLLLEEAHELGLKGTTDDKYDSGCMSRKYFEDKDALHVRYSLGSCQGDGVSFECREADLKYLVENSEDGDLVDLVKPWVDFGGVILSAASGRSAGVVKSDVAFEPDLYDAEITQLLGLTGTRDDEDFDEAAADRALADYQTRLEKAWQRFLEETASTVETNGYEFLESSSSDENVRDYLEHGAVERWYDEDGEHLSDVDDDDVDPLYPEDESEVLFVDHFPHA